MFHLSLFINLGSSRTSVPWTRTVAPPSGGFFSPPFLGGFFINIYKFQGCTIAAKYSKVVRSGPNIANTI